MEPFFHSNEGRNPREARNHLFALRAILPGAQGLLLLDGDNRNLPEREISGDGLTIHRWKRYEIENYLLVPEAFRRFIANDGDLFSSAQAEEGLNFLRQQLPPQTFLTPLEDNATVTAVRASKDILPQAFSAAGRSLEKEDYFLVAEKMRPEEIHPEVHAVLDSIADLFPSA